MVENVEWIKSPRSMHRKVSGAEINEEIPSRNA